MKLKDNYSLGERDVVYMADKYRQCRETYRLHFKGKNIFYREGSGTGYSETSVPIYHVHGVTTKKDNTIHFHYRQNLKSGIKFFVMKMSGAGLSASFAYTFHLPLLYIPEQAIKFHIPTRAKGHLNIRLLQYYVAWSEVRSQY
jgi:hypothetical protein